MTVTLTDEIDVSRGDMLVRPDNLPHVSSQIEAMVVWMAEQPFVPGRTYTLKQHQPGGGGGEPASATASTSTPWSTGPSPAWG